MKKMNNSSEDKFTPKGSWVDKDSPSDCAASPWLPG